MDKRIAIWAVAAIALVAILFLLMQRPQPTGLSVGLFVGCSGGAPNGTCDAADPYDPNSVAETYATCPQDCCDSDCTAKGADSVCRAACFGANGCSIVPACYDLTLGQKFCTTPRFGPTTAVTCCSTQTTCSSTPGSGTYCSGGDCVTCSPDCDDSCQSATCYETDPDCTSLGAATRVCCGDGACETGETTAGCPGDCPAIACDTNAACNLDNNALTVDVCNNPGTYTASCSRLCTARCADNAGCNDDNSLTVDACVRPGACDANCTYTPTCPIACSSNAACSDNNALTLDVCNNPDTCSASCSHQACSVACWDNSECNDNNSLTVDVCRNAGDCAARCSNTACVVACDTNSDCNDNNALTVDACINAGSCNSRCSRTSCRAACTSDANCNDNNAMTIDKCLNPGGCNAACSHSRQQLSIELQVGFENVVVRGQTVDLTILVKDDAGNPVSDAVVSLTDAEGNKITLSSVGDGYYTGQYSVQSNSPLGTKLFSFSAASDGKVAYQELSLEVTKGNISVVLVQPTAFGAVVGQEVEFKFRLVYDNNASVQGATAIAVLKGTAIPLQFDGTVFTGKHLFGEADAGESALVINAADTAGNSGIGSFTFNVVPQFPWVLVVLLLLLVIAIIVALFVLKKKGEEKLQGKWGFKEEEG